MCLKRIWVPMASIRIIESNECKWDMLQCLARARGVSSMCTDCSQQASLLRHAIAAARALFPRQFRNPWPAPALNPKHSSASLWRNTGPLPPINSPAQPAAQAAQFFQTLRRGILRSGRPGGAVMRLGPGEPGAVHADTQQSYSHSPQHSALGRSNSRVRVFLGS